MPTNRSDLWKKYDKGNALSDIELLRLVASLRTGIHFLEERGETGGVLFKARYDLSTLEGFALKRELTLPKDIRL